MQPLLRRHAWLAGPPANTCSRNNPQNKRQQRPAQNKKLKLLVQPLPRRHAWLAAPEGVKKSPSDTGATSKKKQKPTPSCHPLCGGTAPNDHSRGQHTLRHRSNLQEKNNIVIPEFSAWLTLVLEQCRAENIRNLPRQRAPTPLFPERRPREACSMPISGCHDLPLATFNLPSRNRPRNKQQQRPHTPPLFRNFHLLPPLNTL